jgi:phenylacetate-CoA ligase
VALARQYGSRAGLRRYQLCRLNRMLTYVTSSVPYYRRRGGPARLRGLPDMAQIPLLTKSILRSAPSREFVADGLDVDRCVPWVTSGTTGQRVSGWHDQKFHDYHMAACVRRFFATRRYVPTDRLAHVKPYLMPPRAIEKLGLFRRHVILSTTPPRSWVEDLLAYRPRILIGYPVHLRELLRTMTAAELTRLREHLRLVMTESELLVPDVRAALEHAFGVPVRDEYSAFETLNIYFECHRGGRHLAEDRVYVEVVDDHGVPVPDGVEGQLVVTAFGERAMPLVRYAIGDIGLIETQRCPCGRRFRTMLLTRGRLNDSIVLADGTRIFADVFFAISDSEPGVAELHVRQDAQGTIHVFVVPDGTLPVDEILRHAHRTLVGQVSVDLPVEMHISDRLPLTAAGKGQMVVSEYTPASTVDRPV